jgi:hypothetical protein
MPRYQELDLTALEAEVAELAEQIGEDDDEGDDDEDEVELTIEERRQICAEIMSGSNADVLIRGNGKVLGWELQIEAEE